MCSALTIFLSCHKLLPFRLLSFFSLSLSHTHTHTELVSVGPITRRLTPVYVRRMQEMKTEKQRMLIQENGMEGNQKEMLRMLPEKLWWCLSNVFCFCGSVSAVLFIISGWMFEKFKIDDRLCLIISMPFVGAQLGLSLYVFHMHQGMPYRLVGALGRATSDLIALGVAMICRLCYPFDGTAAVSYVALSLLAFLTVQLHCWGQILHLTWDIGLNDVLLQVLMEAVTYMTTGDNITCIFVVFFFCCVIGYRYISYSAPITPEFIKKDLESSSLC